MRKIALLTWTVSPEPPQTGDEGAPVDETAPPDALGLSDANDLASWLREDLAARLADSSVLEGMLVEETERGGDEEDEPEPEAGEPLDPEALRAWAVSAGCALALGGALRATPAALTLRLVLVDDTGLLRGDLELERPLGEVPWLGVELAREVLLSLGEDAAAPPLPLDQPVRPEQALTLARAARMLRSCQEAERTASERIQRGLPAQLWENLADPAEAAGDLIVLLEQAPELTPARELLLAGAAEGASGRHLPSWLRTLEALEAARPDDASVLLLLAALRLSQGERDQATALLVRVRDELPFAAPRDRADALARLSTMAEEDGRTEEAAAHLRAALRLVDDAALSLRLGLLVLSSAPAESIRVLGRAVALEPDQPRIRLEFARALLQLDPERALMEAGRAAQQGKLDPDAAREAEEWLRSILSEASAGHPDA